MVLGDLDDSSHLETMVFGICTIVYYQVPFRIWHLVYGMIHDDTIISCGIYLVLTNWHLFTCKYPLVN